jgi:hypothetical protein
MKNASVNNCTTYLNGLYHVLIQLEKNEVESDVLKAVKETLMSHRNFCEDVADIYILCSLPIGICADIELDADADVADVYIKIVQALFYFFSPSAHFYTLPALLDKGRSIDEIIEGRPIDLKSSHGFIDTKELEAIQLRKEIHLSDVYAVLFEIKGIKTIRNLNLRICSTNQIVNGWKFHIPEFNIPEFSTTCTSIRFTRSGKKIPLDTSKYNSILELSGEKFLYDSVYPNLDIQIPKGTYRKDLSDYYSIQNDFPEVYGIAKGGLPPTVGLERKAQALQLKGYLLFFDQLLANYLSQLQNLPQLYSMGSADNANQHTYFFNYLENSNDPDLPNYIPEVEQLWSWYISPQLISLVGGPGSTLCDVIKLEEVQAYITAADYKQLFGAKPSLFTNWQELNETLSRLQDYFEENGDLVEPQMVLLDEQCWSYYFELQDEKLVFRCASRFSNADLATKHFQFVIENANEHDSYFIFNEGYGKYSLELEVSSASPDSRLQELWERKDDYYIRRNAFLDHLLARFSEKMTDYSLLLWGSLESDGNQQSLISTKENYLSHYPELSSERGKGYDYLVNGWNNQNCSGFEKKVKALSGVNDLINHDLCPFIVTEYEPWFIAELTIGSESFFTFSEKFNNEQEASAAINALLASLKNSSTYQIFPVAHHESYGIEVVYHPAHKAIFTHEYPSPVIASLVIERLNRMFSKEIREHDVFVSKYSFHLMLKDFLGQPVKKTKDLFFSESEARNNAGKLIKKVNELDHWEVLDASNGEKMHFYSNKEHPERRQYLRTDHFRFDPDKTIIDRPDLYTYELLNHTNSFKFLPLEEFHSEGEAKRHACEVLFLGSYTSNFKIHEGDLPNRFALQIMEGDQVKAETHYVYRSPELAAEAAERIAAQITSQIYELELIKEPYQWKFYYQLGYDPDNSLLFTSEKEFDFQKKAIEALRNFINGVQSINVSAEPGKWILSSSVPLVGRAVAPDNVAQDIVEQQLTIQKALSSSLQNNNAQALSKITKDEQTKEGTYVYEVVDKEKQVAFYNHNYYGKFSILKEKQAFISAMKKPVSFLRICEDGDIISERKHTDGNLWYHYQLISHLDDPCFVLFESVMGYPSPDQAMQAFKSLYIQIIDWASSVLEYGNKISMNEIWKAFNPFPLPSEPIVYVPLETKLALGGTDADVILKLLRLCYTYPYRILDPTSPAFETLFCCTPKDKPDDCAASVEWIYYYRLVVDYEKQEAWQSVHYFNSIAAVKAGFEYFQFLLLYPGNVFIDCYDCDNLKDSYRFYIREVMLESTHRFLTKNDAWGPNGIEKYICAEQSFPFYGYQRQEDCCYSFLVYCGPPILIHPCIYDNPETRNKKKQELYRQFQHAQQQHSWQIIEENGENYLTNGKGHRFVQVFTSDKNGLLSFILDCRDDFKAGRFKIKNEKTIHVLFREGEFIDLKERDKEKELLEEIQLFFCYYPFIRYDKDEYGIEIRLPGFSDCEIDQDPCFCDPEEPDPPCWLAWRTSCKYNTLEEMLLAYLEMRNVLLDFKNYISGFECDCHSFTILLKINNQIIAHSPQCYPSRDAACAAIDRTHFISNMEGLHVIEHILLRPHCEEDCLCRQDLICLKRVRCTYPWNVPEADPCDPNPVICFTPGEDPYSFIATALLPGWPKKYRDQDKRKIIESILYQEVPSHILLRTLWLAPIDFCLMETQYKQWTRYLAGKKNCQEDFSLCGFLQDLFHKDFECLPPCKECQPCQSDTTPEPDPCQAYLLKESITAASFTNQIDSIYCWNQMNCEGEDVKDIPVDTDIPETVMLNIKQPKIRHEVIGERKEIFQERAERFHRLLKEVKPNKNNKELLKKADDFFKLDQPSPKKFISVVTQLGIQQALPGSVVSRQKMQLLYTAIICYYLDRILAKQKDISELKVLEEIVPQLLQQEVNLTEVYEIWNANELDMVEDEDKIAFIGTLLLGKSN